MKFKNIILGILSCMISFSMLVASERSLRTSSANAIREQAIRDVGDEPFDLQLTTYSWTQVTGNTGYTLNGRSGVILNNRSANSNSMYFTFSSAAPTTSTTTAEIELEPGENIPVTIANGLELYGVSLNTGSAGEYIMGREVMQ